MLRASDNMISFAVQTTAGAFTELSRITGMGCMGQLMPPYIVVYHELEAIMVFQSCTKWLCAARTLDFS